MCLSSGRRSSRLQLQRIKKGCRPSNKLYFCFLPSTHLFVDVDLGEIASISRLAHLTALFRLVLDMAVTGDSMEESSLKILSILHLHQLPHRANGCSMGNYLVDSVERSAIFVLWGGR